MINLFKGDSGQAMLLTVVMMSGIFMVATAVAGMLTFYQAQEATDVNNSATAIFAADAALEEGIYRYLNSFVECDPGEICDLPVSQFENSAIGEVQVFVPVNEGEPVKFLSFGYDPSRRTTRSLELSLYFGF